MNRIETLAKKFEDHISLPWQPGLSAPEKTIFVVYPKEDERRLRATRGLFEQAVKKAGHTWASLNLDDAFPDWMATQDYAEEYYEVPEDLRQKLEVEFCEYVRSLIEEKLIESGDNGVLGVFGVATLFGFTRLSTVIKSLPVAGRFVVFFPGSHDKNVYRLLDARDGWGYLASPITLTESSYS